YDRSVTSQNVAAGGTVPGFVPAAAQPGTPVTDAPPEINVDHDLVWGEVIDTATSSFRYYVWGDPATSLPPTGTLSYAMAAGAVRTEHHGSATLDAFDLKIKLGGTGSPSFKANLQVSDVPATNATQLPPTVSYNIDHFQP